jgi:hypothetical protein
MNDVDQLDQNIARERFEVIATMHNETAKY